MSLWGFFLMRYVLSSCLPIKYKGLTTTTEGVSIFAVGGRSIYTIFICLADESASQTQMQGEDLLNLMKNNNSIVLLQFNFLNCKQNVNYKQKYE